MSDVPAGPLAGVNIVDFTANMSGPMATMILGDQGADVVKVEPITGDILRDVGLRNGGVSAYFANLNRSKRSIAVDLAKIDSKRIVDALLDWADVVIHNFRPGVEAKHGLDARTARSGRPGLIYVAVNGFGTAGPYGGRPAYDHVVQAMSGLAAIQGGDGDPSLIRNGVVDKITGISAAQAITAALLQRASTGEGQELEVQMLGVATAFQWPDGMMDHTVVGAKSNEPSVARTFRLTKTSDGYLSLILVTAARVKRLAAGLGIDGATDLPDSGAAGPATGRILRVAAQRFSTMTTAEAVDLLLSWDIPAAPVVSLDELADHPQIRAAGYVDEFDHPVLGRIQQANPAVSFAGERAGALRPAPTLGQHTTEVLLQLGFSQPDVDSFRRSGVVPSPGD
ncbi:CaiB/BaiF CoA transferase family protein [Mycolicibacterium pulveris]|uniref:CaiB/BaiF CoA transferase family protein n=1 Tax=Mycolicibacterium pulveris TaxID=36813 RepID=UPI003CEC7CFF